MATANTTSTISSSFESDRDTASSIKNAISDFRTGNELKGAMWNAVIDKLGEYEEAFDSLSTNADNFENVLSEWIKTIDQRLVDYENTNNPNPIPPSIDSSLADDIESQIKELEKKQWKEITETDPKTGETKTKSVEDKEIANQIKALKNYKDAISELLGLKAQAEEAIKKAYESIDTQLKSKIDKIIPSKEFKWEV